MADTPFEIDFASLKSQAADLLDAADKDTTDIPTVETPATPVVEPTPVADKVVAPVVPEVVTPEELDPETQGDRLVRVKVDGQWEVKALKDVVGGYSRTSHFTRQMQDLATQRKEVETERQAVAQLKTENDQIKGLITNKAMLFQFLQQSAPELFAKPAGQEAVQSDPNEIATVGQAQELLTKHETQMQQTLRTLEDKLIKQFQTSSQELENRRETAVYAESISSVVKDIFEKNPILNKYRMAEDIMRFEVRKMEPKTIQETHEAFRTVAQGMVEDLNEGFATVNKTKLATAAKLTTARIEPPGGSGPQIQPTPQNFKRADGTLDWKALHNAAKNFED